MHGCRRMNAKQETTQAGRTFIKIGVSSVATAALLAIGSLIYYGFGYTSEQSALDKLKSGTWAEDAKTKIEAVYSYLFFSFYICVVSASFVFSNPVLFKIFSSPPMMIVDFLVQTLMQNGRTFARINNQGSISKRRLAWIIYCTFLGAVASPVYLMGIKTARISIHLTCIIISSLVVLSFVAPVGKYVAWKQTLSISEIAVFVASIGAALFSVTGTLGALFFTISFYGGLILYPISFLCHSQEAQIAASEQESGYNAFCSVAVTVPMLLDVISVFGRVVVLIPPS